ncbi:AbrB family transcriptional regulator [Actibacterium lipolyticum]|uniref:Putative ammonia monooxygenase n=1 Tax=Actibacterium lipolyticum TaxID=1524263 RepID=A0A238KQB7_9RHOB|nr:AbrB family transcriptional regulator [Actibacterium lipolyticum]SMX44985.1 Putative ammonia monooxygenase [Actibacterium lipolyticum]
MWTTLITLAIGAFGAVAAFWLGIPAPFLTGPAFLVTLCGISGIRVAIPARLRDVIFLIIGTNMGTAVTPEAVATAGKWPLSLIILSLCILAIFLIGARLLQMWFGMDRMSALLTATPGHLSFVIGLTDDLKADISRVTLISSLRVLTLTLLVPFIAPLLTGEPLPRLAPATQPMALPALAAILILATALGLLFQRLRVPAALLLGGMAVSSLAHAFSITEGSVPQWLSLPAFATMGALIGTRFGGVSFRMLAQAMGASATLSSFAAIVSLAGAYAVSQLFGIPIVTVLIAFAPGGLETMMAMSVLLDANPAYVAAHHVFRLVFLTLVLPIVVSRNR